MASIGEERERRQAKVFLKWVNSHLRHRDRAITDLCTDFGDGINLCILYEVISDEKLPRYSMKPRGMIGKTNNLAIVLRKVNSFVEEQGIRLQYSPQQIADGDRRQILGMIWILISKFVIPESEADLSAKRSLLRWVQRVTEPYDNVDVKNFTKSWKDGMAFNALIHQYDNDLFSWDTTSGMDPATALEQAFAQAEGLGIYRLLDVDDITDVPIPDEKSVMTYVSTIYQFFKTRVGEMLKRESEKLLVDIGNLIKWIRAAIQKYSDIPGFTEDEAYLTQLMEELQAFNVTKGRYADYKVALYVKLASIQRRQRNERLQIFVPEDDRNLTVVHTEWLKLNEVMLAYSAAVRSHFDRIEEIRRQKEEERKRAEEEAERLRRAEERRQKEEEIRRREEEERRKREAERKAQEEAIKAQEEAERLAREQERARVLAEKKAKEEAEREMLQQYNTAAGEYIHWVTDKQHELTAVKEVAEDEEDLSTPEDVRAARVDGCAEAKLKIAPSLHLWEKLVSNGITEWASIPWNELQYSLDTFLFAVSGEESESLDKVKKVDLAELHEG